MACRELRYYTTTVRQHFPSKLLPRKMVDLKMAPQTVKSSPRRGSIKLKIDCPKSIQMASDAIDPVVPTISENETSLKIGILGFGKFGQFIAQTFKRQRHHVLATSRSDYSEYCRMHGIQFFSSVEEMCQEEVDIIVVSTSILSTEAVLKSIPIQKLKPDTIFVDVLSVKQYPRNLFLQILPRNFGILCTHPMFGPESGKDGWLGLPLVYDKVRIPENPNHRKNYEQFLQIFQKAGCRMVEMSCEEHDRQAASTQFITHTIGRILSHLDLQSTPIDTKGYAALVQLTENTMNDSFDLYSGLFMYNVNSIEQIERLERAFEMMKQKLYRRVHETLKRQIEENTESKEISQATYAHHFLPETTGMEIFTSFVPSTSTVNFVEKRR